MGINSESGAGVFMQLGGEDASPPELVDRQTYHELASRVEKVSPIIGTSWNFLADKSRQYAIGDDPPEDINRIHLGEPFPVIFKPDPDFSTDIQWSEKRRRNIGKLDIPSLRNYVGHIEGRIGDESVSAIRRKQRLHRYAGLSVTPRMFEIMRAVAYSDDQADGPTLDTQYG